MFSQKKYIAKFIDNSRGHLEKIKLHFEKVANSSMQIFFFDDFLSSVHTIKGNARLLKFNTLAEILAKMEKVVKKLKEQNVPISEEIVALLSRSIEVVYSMLHMIEAGQELTVIDEELYSELDKIIESDFDDYAPDKFHGDEQQDKWLNKFLLDGRGYLKKIKEGIVSLDENPEDTLALHDLSVAASAIKGSAKILKITPLADATSKLSDAINILKDNKTAYSEEISHIFSESIDTINTLFNKIEANEKISLQNESTPLDELEKVTKLKQKTDESKGQGEFKKEAAVSTEVKQQRDAVKKGPEKQTDFDKKTSDKKEVYTQPKKVNLSKYVNKFLDDTKESIYKIDKIISMLEKAPYNKELLNEVYGLIHTVKGNGNMLNIEPVVEVAHRIEDFIEEFKTGGISDAKEFYLEFNKKIDTISYVVERIAAGDDMELLMEQLSSSDFSTMGVSESEDVKKTFSVPTIGERLLINANKLDELINLVGEVVSYQSKFKYKLAAVDNLENLSNRVIEKVNLLEGDSHSSKYMKELSNVTSELHETIKEMNVEAKSDVKANNLLINDLKESSLNLRMLPFSTIFDSFKRLVRDAAKTCNKEVEIVIEGETTEVDKEMIEKVGESLEHMIRNSIFHGIETPDERKKADKPEIGTVYLSASLEGGYIYITVADDGRGIDIELLKSKVKQEDIYNEKDLVNLIFKPGVSTSDTADHVAGRGIGMDVVKKNIDSFGGSISVSTQQGQGTTFSIEIPLTMAIMRLMVVSVSEQIFSIPITSIKEVVRLKQSECIYVAEKRKAIRIRDEIIPVVDLGFIVTSTIKRLDKDEFISVIITSTSHGKYGLIVDSLVADDYMVVKPLPGVIKELNFVSGLTIWGRDDIISVLNIQVIIQKAKQMKELEYDDEISEEHKKRILIVEDSVTTREIEKDILEAYGYEVELAEDGLDAIEKTESILYDLVITDIEMPRLDGFSLIKQLRGNELYKDVPIIIVSSRDEEEDRKKGLYVGANAYIIKGSFDQTNLVSVVKNLI